MRAAVVYESMYGNTEEVAKAVAEGLARYLEVTAVEVSGDPQVSGLDLVVVGGPTHAFTMSWASTRSDAATRERRAVISQVGIREWLDALPQLPGVAAAAFDTRIRRPRLPGSAAKAAMKRLRRLDATLIAPPETYWVDGTTGPLLPRELDRARAWGERLGRELASSRATTQAGHSV